jgi:site-specific DNA-cytosine methylase
MKKTDRVMTVESGLHRAYRMYITDGVSPAITTPSGGGGLIPKIIEMKEEPKIVSYSRDKKGKIENYHTKEVANTIHCSTGTRGNTAQYVLEPKPIVEMNKYPSNHGETVSIAEPFVVACRGRPKGGQGEYGVKFETKMDGTSNALTRATRLNLVAEPSNEPNVLTPKRTEYGKKVRKEWESHKLIQQRKYMQQLEPRTDGVSNTITSVQKDNMLLEPLRIKANTREGFAEVEEYGAVNISQPSSRTRRGRVQGNKGDIIGTLLTGEENAVLEPKTEEVRRVAEEVRRQPCGVSVDKDNNLRPYRQDKAKSGVAELQTEFAESVGSTLTSARPNNVYGDTFPYRIRRLIPRECFRLMDVDDEDYDKIKNYVKGHRKNGKPMYISESQQYKLAGNSIVVACMEHIFEQLFFPSGRVTEPRQLDIFDII